jgi:tetratricopeptide (TPR) repeat protein
VRLSLSALVILIPLHIWTASSVVGAKGDFDSKYEADVVMPGSLLRITSLDFKGLTADRELLDAIFFVGRLLGEGEVIKGRDWNYFERKIDASAALDPYFYDTFYFGSTMLTWGAGRYEAAVLLLEQAVKNKPDDWRMLFNLGFIHYYFLHDSLKGSEYIGRAAEIKGAPSYYANLAARLAYDAGSHETAVSFLLKMLESTNNENVRDMYEKRLYALKGAIELERASAAFRKKTGVFPFELDELVRAGFIEKIPADPYGGEYCINEKGRVFSTSNFTEIRR